MHHLLESQGALSSTSKRIREGISASKGMLKSGQLSLGPFKLIKVKKRGNIVKMMTPIMNQSSDIGKLNSKSGSSIA